jgi:hypothetical protein
MMIGAGPTGADFHFGAFSAEVVAGSASKMRPT